MRISRLDTVRTEEFPNLVHLLIHTDEGLTGLGETFFFADAVEGHIHGVLADYLLGKNPADIERHSNALRGYVGAASSGAEMRAASAVDIALWDLRGKELDQPLYDLLGGRSRDRIRTYNTCAGERYVRGRHAQAVSNWGIYEPSSDGRHEDLEAFLHHPDAAGPQPPRRGCRRDEDLAVRPLRRGEPRSRYIGRRARARARAVPPDSRGGRG